MKNYKISFYDKFNCIGPECPATCCRGYRILVDDETWENIKSDETALGKSYRRKIKVNEDRYLKKTLWGGCPMETKNSLCKLQQAERYDLMPIICRQYPRLVYGYGKFSESCLELACPEVARIFLENIGSPVRMLESQSRDEILWTLANDDASFLDFLVKSRTELLDLLADTEMAYGDRIDSIINYSKDCHNLIIRDKLSEADELSIYEYISQDKGKRQHIWFDFELLDKIIVCDAKRSRLIMGNPRLYSLIRAYHKIFDKLTAAQACTLVEETIMTLGEEKYVSYLSYVIMQTYLTAYEGYHIMKPLLMALLYTDILMIIDTVALKTEGEYPLADQAVNLAAMEKRFRHNESLSITIFNRIRDF